MKSAWVDSEAQAAIDRYARAGIGRDLALRVYTTRLLGRDPKPVRLDRLRKLRARAVLGDEDIVRVQRASLIAPAAPNPSVEILLHAFLPHTFVDHTHANAVLSIVDQPDGEMICRELYDGRASVVRYVRPGFLLAKAAAEIYDTKSAIEGLILHKHGIVTFGRSAREAYERMIALV